MQDIYLVKWNKAKQAIIEAHSIDEVKQIRDQAEAYRYALRLAGEAPDIVRMAEEIKVRAERRAGEMLKENIPHDGGRPKKPSLDARVSETKTLIDLDITYDQSSSWQRMADITEEKFEEYIETVPEITTAGALRLANNVHFSSDSHEWYTPQNIIDYTIKVFDKIDLDPCSDGAKNIPASNYFTQEDDGLKQIWFGKVYMNPPYGNEIGKWIHKLKESYKDEDIKEAIALVPSRTDTEWFRELKEYPRCFIWGRLRFSNQENSAPFPSMIVYLGNNLNKFVEIFNEIGDVYLLI